MQSRNFAPRPAVYSVYVILHHDINTNTVLLIYILLCYSYPIS